jgi:hypothetical protein
MESHITRTCVIAGGVRRLHSTYPDGTEIVEEFNISTHELLNRKVKHLSKLGEGKWEWEVGEGPRQESEIKQSGENVMKNQPIFLRKDTLQEFQWRVRNLPYPPSTYSVTGDGQTGKITIRTTNKKYFKVFSVPDLARVRAHLDPGLIRWGHEFNTLVISVIQK